MLRISRPTLFSVLALGILLAPLGCNKENQQAQNATPQAAFDAAKAAMDKKDYQGFCSNLTPESRDAVAGTMAVAGVMMEQVAGLATVFGGAEGAKEANEKLAPIREALKKHDVDKDAIQAKVGELQGEPDPKELAKLAESIKDKNAFISDMLAAMEKLDEGAEVFHLRAMSSWWI